MKRGILFVLGVIISVVWISSALAAEPRLIASDEREKAYLYVIGENQFSVKFKDVSGVFTWEIDPRADAPKLRVFDYDQDGEKEIAVSLCIGTGTGLDIDALHIVKLQDGKLVSYTYTEEEYTKRIKDAVAFKVARENSRLIAEFSSGRDSIRIDVTKSLNDYSPKDSEMRLECGDVVSFSPKTDGTIVLRAALGTKVSDTYAPDYYADLTANVVFTDGTFSLSNIRIVASPLL